MAKKEFPNERPAELAVKREDACKRISDQIQKGKRLIAQPRFSQDWLETTKPNFFKWDSYNGELLQRVFTTNQLASEYNATPGMFAISMHPSIEELGCCPS